MGKTDGWEGMVPGASVVLELAMPWSGDKSADVAEPLEEPSTWRGWCGLAGPQSPSAAQGLLGPSERQWLAGC